MIARLFISISGVTVTIIGLASVIGYLVDSPRLYGWFDGRTAMAPNTATAIVLIGISLVVFGLSHRPWGTDK